MEDLIYKNRKRKGRALVSYATLLTPNQGLSESMDALKTKFQGKVLSAAPRKGVVRLGAVRKGSCCKVITGCKGWALF